MMVLMMMMMMMMTAIPSKQNLDRPTDRPGRRHRWSLSSPCRLTVLLMAQATAIPDKCCYEDGQTHLLFQSNQLHNVRRSRHPSPAVRGPHS
jgi:hypothetical protein